MVIFEDRSIFLSCSSRSEEFFKGERRNNTHVSTSRNEIPTKNKLTGFISKLKIFFKYIGICLKMVPQHVLKCPTLASHIEIGIAYMRMIIGHFSALAVIC